MTLAVRQHLADGVLVEGCWPSLVHTLGLGLGDPGQLTFLAQVRLKLSKDRQHLQKALTTGRAGVDIQIKDNQARALLCDLVLDLEQVQSVAGQSVQLPHDELVALAQGLQNQFQHRASVTARRAGLLFMDDGAGVLPADGFDLHGRGLGRRWRRGRRRRSAGTC